MAKEKNTLQQNMPTPASVSAEEIEKALPAAFKKVVGK